MTFELGINNCFAVKRWPAPDEWAQIVSDELGLDLVQHSFDLVDFSADDEALEHDARSVHAACHRAAVSLHSTFTGLVAYSSSLLLAPDPAARSRAVDWYRRVINYTASAGATVTGGHLGSLSVRDSLDPARAAERWGQLGESLEVLRRAARQSGLRTLLVENMACAREPSTLAQIPPLLSDPDERRAGVALCLDVGHQCVPGTSSEDRDPYAWLRLLGGRSAVVHLQQSDELADHHWPFTASYNAAGRIQAPRVLESLGRARPALIIEVIPPFEAGDAQVLEELRESVAYWRAAIAEHAGAGADR